jgi:8-oxo-dGTP diphosphatase
MAIKVVCGIIWQGDKIFIARRRPEKSLGGYWEFPGGKIEEGEEPEIALVRELKEELGMEVNVINYFGSSIHHYETISIELVAYICAFKQASFHLIDHDLFEFVSYRDISKYTMAPADLPLVKLMQLQIENETLKHEVKGLRFQLGIHKSALQLHEENFTSAAADLLINPNPIRIHSPIGGKQRNYLVTLQNIIAIKSVSRGKYFYLKEPVEPEEGGAKTYCILVDEDKMNFNNLLFTIQKRGHHLMLANRSVAINIYHYVFSVKGHFTLCLNAPKDFDENLLDVKTDSKFDVKLYHNRLMEIDRLNKHHKDFTVNVKKIKEISRSMNRTPAPKPKKKL